ncbi:hypothetical protein D3C73_1009350 [compost metagenome]
MHSRNSFGLLHILRYFRRSANKKAGAVQFDFFRKPALILLDPFKVGYCMSSSLCSYILRRQIVLQQGCSFHWHWHGYLELASFLQRRLRMRSLIISAGRDFQFL